MIIYFSTNFGSILLQRFLSHYIPPSMDARTLIQLGYNLGLTTTLHNVCEKHIIQGAGCIFFQLYL